MEGESDQYIKIYNVFAHTHTLGSNSTATLGPRIVELITFGAISWSIIVFIMIALAFYWLDLSHGKWLVSPVSVP